jgi:hypothetical protein
LLTRAKIRGDGGYDKQWLQPFSLNSRRSSLSRPTEQRVIIGTDKIPIQVETSENSEDAIEDMTAPEKTANRVSWRRFIDTRTVLVESRCNSYSSAGFPC